MLKPAILALLAASLPLSADTVTVYRTFAAWDNAAKSAPNVTIETDSFAGDQITLPGLHIDRLEHGHPAGSGCDAISGGTCYTGESPSHELIIHLDKEIYGFGANLDYLMFGGISVQPGNAIGIFNVPEVALDPPGVRSCALEPVCDQVHGFVGFVTDFPFNYLYFDNTVAFGQSFNMSQPSFAVDSPTPEPGTLGLFTLPLIFLGLWRKRAK